MKMTSSIAGNTRGLAMLGLATALLMSAATTVAAQSRGSTSASRLVGTWALTVTLRDCATNAAMGAPFNSLATINSDGTSIGSTASLAFAAGQRSLEHGSWFHQGGHRYSESVVALIVFDSAANLPGTPEFDPTLPVRPGLYAGWQTITHTLVLQDANHYTAAGTTQFYSADGSVYRRGCSSSVGERFE